MAGISYKDGATWRTMSAIHYKDGATWRTLSEVWYKEGATWRQVFAAAAAGTVAISNQTVDGGGDAGLPQIGVGSYSLQSGGLVEISETDGMGGSGTRNPAGEWLVSGTNSDFEARMTTVSGTLTSGTAGSWLNLGTTRTWTKSRSIAGVATYVGTLEIRDVATSTVQDTATITINASA